MNLREAEFGGLLFVRQRDRYRSTGQPWRGFLGVILLGASLAWSAAAQAGGDPNAVDKGGVPLTRAGAPLAPTGAPLIIESPATTGVPSGPGDVVVVSGEGTQVYSLTDYLALEAAGNQPAAATPPSETIAPEQPVSPPALPAPPAPIVQSAPVPQAAPQAAPQAPTQTAAREPDGDGLGGFLSELRIGVLAHDVGAFGRKKEEGTDINAEVLFTSPEFLEVVFSPRPHLGITVNTGDDTSQVYAGLTWDWTFWDPFFVEGTLGFAVHDGETDIESREKKALGCKLLFRESVSLGARFLDSHSISASLAHISNAKLCEKNEGLDTFGVRYGYSF